ncbi:hypothetical protein [Corynebacterium nasicanis]
MDHLQLTSATADHLLTLLRRTTAPSSPSLPPGSRTAAALGRAAASWDSRHRHAESLLRDHVSDVRRFVERVDVVDRSAFPCFSTPPSSATPPTSWESTPAG